jgi:hypothetical protein
MICMVLLAGLSVANQKVMPEPTDEKLTNPHMGFIYYGGNEHPEMADVYYTSALTWGHLEPEEGKYIWNLDDPAWNNARVAIERGKRVVVRVMPSFQNNPYATPKWVHDLGVRRFPASEIQRQHGQEDLYEPEWWNPVYIEKYCNFVRAMGRELDGKPWLDWVDMRYYGFWGEGHRYSAEVPWPGDVDKRETLKRFIDAHLDAFKKTPLVVQTAKDEDTPYPEGTAIDYAVAKGCWMRRDGFGPYLHQQEIDFIRANWRHSLMIAENGGSYSDFADGRISRWWEPGSNPITLEECLDQMLDLHCNYIPLGWGDPDWRVLEDHPALLKKLWMRMGYRLVIDEAELPAQARPGSTFPVRHVWRNTGVGRLPRKYPLAVYLVDGNGERALALLDESFDQTGWVDGERYAFEHDVAVPSDLAPGTRAVCIALVYPDTKEPAIALGIKGDIGGRMYRLADIEIVNEGG